MRGKIGILMVIALTYPLGVILRGMPAITPPKEAISISVANDATTIEMLADKIQSIDQFAANVDYEVSLAMTDEDVVYTLEIASDNNPADSLIGCNYLIDWRLDRNGDVNRGFTAYFDGHCYRYRNNRLQEYHFLWDSVPFLSPDGGVQRNGQFVELLPQSIASELRQIASSPHFEFTLRQHAAFNGRDVTELYATETVQGYVGRNLKLVVDNATSRPLLVENEYNPAQISEQSVRALFTYPNTPALRAVSDEENLVSLYPRVFENYRESNYRIENMEGLLLPEFSLPTIDGQRFTHHKGDAFMNPVVVALLEADNGAAKPTIDALRKAVNSMPRETTLILAFVGSHKDSVEELVGSAGQGEYLLLNGKSLARTCGANAYPTILLADTSGRVKKVVLGYNNSLTQDVIQSLALLN